MFLIYLLNIKRFPKLTCLFTRRRSRNLLLLLLLVGRELEGCRYRYGVDMKPNPRCTPNLIRKVWYNDMWVRVWVSIPCSCLVTPITNHLHPHTSHPKNIWCLSRRFSNFQICYMFWIDELPWIIYMINWYKLIRHSVYFQNFLS
jgi:hypothetical protein